jgi:Mrp family chromosome partitioning ATPase
MKFKGLFKRDKAKEGGAGGAACPNPEQAPKDGEGCKSCSVQDCPSRKEQDGRLQKNLARIKNKVVVLSGKGGVGKSTVAANIAVALVHSGHRVGLLDVDVHGPSIPRVLGLSDQRARLAGENLAPVLWGEGLKVMSLGFLLPDDREAVIWRGPVKMGLIKQFVEEVDWGDLDYLVVDCPPGTGDEPLSVLQLLGKDARAVIVTTPQGVAIDDVRRSITFCSKVGNPVLGVVENMSGFVCPTCSDVVDVFGSGGGRALAEEMGVDFLGKIPLDPRVTQSGDSGQIYLDANPDQPTAKAFAEIVESIETSASG